MDARYKVKRRISVEIGGAKNGLRTSTSSPPGFTIFDSRTKHNLPEFYSSQADAERECDRLNKEDRVLRLDRSTRKLLIHQNALCTDLAGQEVFVGLSRQESERYIQLWSEATDEFIDLERKHKRALYKTEDL